MRTPTVQTASHACAKSPLAGLLPPDFPSWPGESNDGEEAEEPAKIDGPSRAADDAH